MPSPSYMADRSPSSSDASTSGGAGHIEHTVSKLDTLAGVAIKYGVEVADVKRLNGLTTDLQMFALKTLRIPTPGRHPPSTASTDPSHSRWETSTTHSGLHRVRSQDSVTNHQGGEKTQRSAAMDLLRGYYGLPASRTEGEGTELATFSFDNENAEDEPFSPMFLPSDTANSRRFSTNDYRTSRFDQSLETRNSSEPSLATTGLLMKPSTEPLGIGEKFGEIEVVSETDPHIKERPVRRRGKGDSVVLGSLNDDVFDVSERVNFSEKVSAPRAKDSNSGFNRQGTPVATNGWHNAGEGPLGSSGVKTIGAALFGGKGAVEGLISKVLQSTVPESGKSSTGALPTSTGTPSVLEGITQVYRRAKAALD